MLRPGLNIVTVLLTLASGLTGLIAKGSFGNVQKEATLEELRAALPYQHVWAEPTQGLSGTKEGLGGGRVRTLDGPMSWQSCYVRTEGDYGVFLSETELPPVKERVYLNVPVYNKGNKTYRVPPGLPLLILRGSSKK